jgi:hypothetical protein
VLDEVEEATVGPLEVFEDENGRALGSDPLEEDPPGGEEESRPPAGAGSRPSRVRSAGSTQRRSSSPGTCSATVAANRSRVVSPSSKPGSRNHPITMA